MDITIDARHFVDPWGTTRPELYAVTLSVQAEEAEQLLDISERLQIDPAWMHGFLAAQNTVFTSPWPQHGRVRQHVVIPRQDYAAFKAAVRAAKEACAS